MVSEKHVNKWVDEKIISETQAKKILSYSSKKENEFKSNKFISIVSIIGAVLIFVGFAWMIARNWHQIPDFIKIIILVVSTLGAFSLGVEFRKRKHEGIGRSLLALGALLYTLSIFLIAQIYSTSTSLQGTAFLLLLCWPIVLLTSYMLNSKENLFISIVIFFFWAIIQYQTSLTRYFSEEAFLFGVILIFLSAGMLLYGLSILHKTLKHKFTNLYKFWTTFYFLAIFYIISFQSTLPVLSNYSFQGSFSIFLTLFVSLCLIGFIFGIFYTISKKLVSAKEIGAFIGILVVLFLLIFSVKIGASGVGELGYCEPTSCYDFQTNATCISAPSPLICKWMGEENDGMCAPAYSRESVKYADYPYEPEMVSPDVYDSTEHWELCQGYNNQREDCINEKTCNWNSSYRASDKLPTSLWILWIVNNLVFIGFILLVLWYGQKTGSTKIVNLALAAFILEIFSRYIGFWMDFQGYFAFSILAILGGVLLIAGSWIIPKWRRKLIEETEHSRR